MNISSALKLSIVLNIVLVGCLIWQYQTQNRFTDLKDTNQDIAFSSEKPLSTLTRITVAKDCDLYVIVNSDNIMLDPFEKGCNGYPLSIDESKYPKLFKQGVANSSFISAEMDKNADMIIVLSNNQPDHGGYSPVYQLAVDLKSSEVREIKK